MNHDEEEKMIYDKISSAKMRVEEIKKQIGEMTLRKNEAEKFLADCEQAAMDYMSGNGLVETECFKITKTQVVDVPDVEALPEEYVRITKAPDKRKIAAVKPSGNWYAMRENVHILLKRGV